MILLHCRPTGVHSEVSTPHAYITYRQRILTHRNLHNDNIVHLSWRWQMRDMTPYAWYDGCEYDRCFFGNKKYGYAYLILPLILHA